MYVWTKMIFAVSRILVYQCSTSVWKKTRWNSFESYISVTNLFMPGRMWLYAAIKTLAAKGCVR